MIPPRQQWCIQIEITNDCPRRCSNCTRLLAHTDKHFYMDVPTFEKAVQAVADFPEKSVQGHRRKVIGIMGGEPLLHPDFPQMVEIMCHYIPQKNRGLWTGLPWARHKYAEHVRKLLGPEPSTDVTQQATAGYLNNNLHNSNVVHQPVLVSVEDVVPDKEQMWKLINACWLQEQWSSSITPKGFFFCEVAASLDMIFEGPGGLPIAPGCWQHDLSAYQSQISQWCVKCGVCIPTPGRRDSENKDDISPTNYKTLLELGSPRVCRGEYELVTLQTLRDEKNWTPQKYMR